jgi:hypothetical protein
MENKHINYGVPNRPQTRQQAGQDETNMQAENVTYIQLPIRRFSASSDRILARHSISAIMGPSEFGSFYAQIIGRRLCTITCHSDPT